MVLKALSTFSAGRIAPIERVLGLGGYRKRHKWSEPVPFQV